MIAGADRVPRPFFRGATVATTRFTLAGVAIVLLAAAPLASAMLGDPYLVSIATRAAIFAVAAVSLQLVVGFGGLISLGHAAFLGIGAYALLILGSVGLGDAAVSIPIAIGAAAAFAFATGWIALRTRGAAFIMITLAFGQMAYFIAQSLEAFGGSDGMPLDRPAVFGTGLVINRISFLLATVVVLVTVTLLAHTLGQSRFGRALRAARESEARVVASGFDVRWIRLITYTLGGGGGGLAGWLLAVHAEFVSPAVMEWRTSGELLVMVILGGSVAPEGAIIGAVALVLGEEALSGLTQHWRLILGPLIVLAVLAGSRRRRPR